MATELSGKCGENAYWHLIPLENNYCILIIHGAGKMYDYSRESNKATDIINIRSFASPSSFKIKNIVIEDGIESVGSYCFCDYRELVNVKLADSVTTIGRDSFSFDIKLENLLAKNVNSIGIAAFYGCSALKRKETNGLQISDDCHFETAACHMCTNLSDETGAIIQSGILFQAPRPVNDVVEIPEGVRLIDPFSFTDRRCSTIICPSSVNEFPTIPLFWSHANIIMTKNPKLQFGPEPKSTHFDLTDVYIVYAR